MRWPTHPFLVVVAVLPFLLTGCFKYAVPKTLTASDLNEEALLFGSYEVGSDWTFKVRPIHETKPGILCPEIACAICDRPQPTTFRERLVGVQSSEPLHFCLKLPPGRYEFITAERPNGDGQELLFFHREFSLAAGEMKYVGEIRVGPPLRDPDDGLLEVFYKPPKSTVSGRNELVRDVLALSQRYPDISWDRATFDASVFGGGSSAP